MQQITVVVTGAGSTVGLGIAKALRASQLPIRIVGTDSEPLSVGLFRLDQGYLLPSARGENKEPYFEALIEVCRKENAAIVMSGWEGDLVMVAERKAEFEQRSGAIAPLNPSSVLVGLDKWLTYKALHAAGVPVPDTALPTDPEQLEAFRQKHSYPFLLKARCSSGSRGVVMVHNDEEFNFFRNYLRDPVMQERLLPDDQEYTVGLFFQTDGHVAGALSLKRSLMAGLSYRMESVQHPEVCKTAIQAAAALGMLGPANVQMRLTPDGPKVFEVNPRFSSATCVRAQFGLNEPEMAVRHFVLGERLSPPTVKEGICLRFWEEMYFPIDAKSAAQRGDFSYRGDFLSQI
ncbi:MAG TPA: ATP-grasp domain-containing protein [Synechococcales cyanobacterium M55_K2018_004]|nr:ATP-grasp domain-containing protein [Synechococcales cyanobacterium M55_K2018_004]